MSSHDPTPFPIYINDLLGDISNKAIYSDAAIIYSKCDQALELSNNSPSWLLNLT